MKTRLSLLAVGAMLIVPATARPPVASVARPRDKA